MYSSAFGPSFGSLKRYVALVGDRENHLDGILTTSPQSQWTIKGKLVTTVGSTATSDRANHPTGPTTAATGSAKFTIAGQPIHRRLDSRTCGAETKVSTQTQFSVGQ